VDLTSSYFELFECPVGYEIDQANLSDKYLQLQKIAHPDRFAAGTDQEKRLAAQFTARINEGYETLRHPLKLAIYLLEQEAVTIEHNPTLDPMFLMEQIELREELEEIGDAGEHGLPRLDKFRQQGKNVLAELQSEFSSAYPSHLESAEQSVYKMQFIHKLMAEAKQLEEKILDY
jgi:molecular chaperone HscB